MPLLASAREVPVSRTNPAHTQPLLEAGYFELVPEGETPIGTIFCFTVPNHSERVDRFIQHPAAINECVPEGPAVTLPSIAERCGAVHSGSHMLALDFKSYYPQFPLDASIRNRFCVRLPLPTGGTVLARLCVGPTGMRTMVPAAVAVTEQLVNFAHPNVKVMTYIDNVAAIGALPDLLAFGREFMERCAKCRVTIKEDTSDLQALITRKAAWCGPVLDFVAKEASLAQKHLDKVDLSWSLRGGWSFAGLWGHLGLLGFAAQIIAVPMREYFNLMRFVSAAAQRMHATNNEEWDTPAAPLLAAWPTAVRELELWTNVVLANKPRAVPNVAAPDALMLIDACADGYGLVAMRLDTGKTLAHQARWPADIVAKYGDDLRSSVYSETIAAILAKRHLLSVLPPSDRARVILIGTDSVTAKAILERGYSCRSFLLNELAKIDRTEFPTTACVFTHVPGKLNVLADDLGRRGASATILTDDDAEKKISECLRRFLGDYPIGGRNAALMGVGKSDCVFQPALHSTQNVNKKKVSKLSSEQNNRFCHKNNFEAASPSYFSLEKSRGQNLFCVLDGDRTIYYMTQHSSLRTYFQTHQIPLSPK